jgi:hypothetical protein
MTALQKHGVDATISPMLDRHTTRLSRYAGTIMAFVFAIVGVTSSICPVCLSQDLLSTRQTAAHTLNHHHGIQDCDRDGCSCCGFQFVATVYQTIQDTHGTSAAPAPLAAFAPTHYPSDFYHPPRV